MYSLGLLLDCLQVYLAEVLGLRNLPTSEIDVLKVGFNILSKHSTIFTKS